MAAAGGAAAGAGAGAPAGAIAEAAGSGPGWGAGLVGWLGAEGRLAAVRRGAEEVAAGRGEGGGLCVAVDARRAAAWGHDLGVELLAAPHRLEQEISEWLAAELDGRAGPLELGVTVRPFAPDMPLKSVRALLSEQSSVALRGAVLVEGLIVAEAAPSQRMKVCFMRCGRCSREAGLFLPLGPAEELQREVRDWCCGVNLETYEEDPSSRIYEVTKAVLLAPLDMPGGQSPACEPLEVVLGKEMAAFSLGDVVRVLGHPRMLERGGGATGPPREGTRFERRLVLYAINAEAAPPRVRMEAQLATVRAAASSHKALHGPGTSTSQPRQPLAPPAIVATACDLAAVTGLREGTAAALILSATSLLGGGPPLNVLVSTAAPADAVLGRRLREAARLLLPFNERLRPLRQIPLADARPDAHGKKAATSWCHAGQASRAAGGGLLASLDSIQSKAEAERALHEISQLQSARSAQLKPNFVLWAHAAKSGKDGLLPPHAGGGGGASAFQIVSFEESADLYLFDEMDEGECARFHVELMEHMFNLAPAGATAHATLLQIHGEPDAASSFTAATEITPQGEALVREYFLLARASSPAGASAAQLSSVEVMLTMAAASARFDGRRAAEAFPDCALAVHLADTSNHALRGASLWGARAGEGPLPSALARAAERLGAPPPPLGAPAA